MRIKNLEKAENLPIHQSMRRSSDYDSWKYDRHYEYTWRMITRMLDSQVGKPFDEVYSYIVKKYKGFHLKKASCLEMRSIIDHIIFGERHYPEFKVDDNGIFRKVEHKHKKKDIVIKEVIPGTITYKLNAPSNESELSIHSRLKHIIGYDNYESLKNGRVTEERYNKLEKLFYNGVAPIYPRYNYGNEWWLKGIFTCYAITDEKVLKYHSPEYYQYRYEWIDKKHKDYRNWLKEREAKAEQMIHDLHINKIRELWENENNIVRHGFDLKTSFRK